MVTAKEKLNFVKGLADGRMSTKLLAVLKIIHGFSTDT
jgi:hypothetical protein